VDVGALVLGLIGPDLTFLAARAAPGVLPRRVVPLDNAAHHWLPPVLLLPVTIFVPTPVVFTLVPAWLAHGRQRAAV